MGIAHGWKGYYEVTPDHNGLVGEAPGIERLLYATGFSGHGFMQAPAVGEIVRDLVLGREPFVDVSPLSVERFAPRRLAARAQRHLAARVESGTNSFSRATATRRVRSSCSSSCRSRR